jgi:hypothetical protein
MSQREFHMWHEILIFLINQHVDQNINLEHDLMVPYSLEEIKVFTMIFVTSY